MIEKRDIFVQKVKAKLDEWNAEIDHLSARAEQAGAEAKGEYRRELEELRHKRDEARLKLKKLEQAGEGAWKDLQAGAEMAASALSEALKSVRQRFK